MVHTTTGGMGCVLGWCLATGIFFGGIAVPGGTAVGDAYLIIYPTWAVSHGPVRVHVPRPTQRVSPAWPPRFTHSSPGPADLSLGSAAAHPSRPGPRWATTVTRLSSAWCGGPRAVARLPNTSDRIRGVDRPDGGLSSCWCGPPGVAARAGSPQPSSSWRAFPRFGIASRCMHTLKIVVAMGFALAAMACALRSQWAAAGVLVVLAILTQQFALLVAIPLFVIAPASRKLPFIIGGAVRRSIVSTAAHRRDVGERQSTHFPRYGQRGRHRRDRRLGDPHPNWGAALSRVPSTPPGIGVALSWYVVRRLGPQPPSNRPC